MKIYINNVLQKTEILPSNTPTLDETLETFSFALISNTNPIPLAPMQKVDVDFLGDGSEIAHFYIVSDSVETYSLNPLRYKHNVSCIQNTRELSKHLVRNSVFSQPSYLFKKSYNAVSQGAFADGSSGGLSSWHNAYISPSNPNLKSEPLHLTSKEKIKKAYFKLSFQFGYGQYSSSTVNLKSDAHNKNDILAAATSMTSITIDNTLILRYKDTLGITQTRTINPSYFNLTDFELNSTFEFPLIKELANLGCNDFELLFNNRLFLDGTYSVDDVRVLFWMAQLEIAADIYYWSCYDVLNLLIKRQQKIDSKNQNALPLFLLPEENDNPDLYNLLKNTIAPNFTFTQLTMYECVAEVFRLFDAIFTMDEDGVLGIEYFNDLSKEKIVPRITGRNLSLGEDKYTNGLVSYYQDARIIEQFPKNKDFAPLRSAEFGVPEAQDHNFIVPHNIQSIVKFEVLLGGLSVNFSEGTGMQWNAASNMALDITDFVVDESVWSTLDTGAMQDSDYDSYIVKQANSVYFTKGDNKIKIAATFKDSWNITHYTLEEIVQMAILKLAGVYTAVASSHPRSVFYPHPNPYAGTWRSVKMRLTYTATVDGETKIHSLTNKYPGETLIDQANGAVDLNKLGLNMLGLALKLGNPTLNATHRITTWAKRIKQGQLYEYQGALWVANVVNYTFFKGMIQGKVSFVQNFNALSLRTQLLREKRMSNISQQLTQKSEEIITDYIYYSSKEPFYLGFQGEEIRFKTEYLSDFLRDSFDIVGPFSCVGDVITYNPDLIVNHFIFNATYIPLVTYGAGNTVNFEISYEHPMNAGNRTTYTSNWVGETKYFTDHVLYTDKFGFIDTICVKAPTTKQTYNSDFPYVEAVDETQQEGDYYFLIKDLQICKQPNEIFALNYQLAFLPLPNRELTDFIGSAFINNNCFVNDMSSVSNRTLYIYFKEEKASVLDTKVGEYIARRKITNVQASRTGVVTQLEFTFQTLEDSLKNRTISWAICDENENVMFASNEKSELTNTNVSIWFMSRLSRLD